MSHDSGLQKAVLDELAWEPAVTAAHIGVAAENGVVTLTGHVGSYAEKHAAALAAGRVRGAKAVADELEVRLPVETKRDDTAIAAAAVEGLAWDVSVPRDAVQVRVEDGWVTLTGQVDHHYQQQLAAQDVRNLIGVVGLSNTVTIRPQVDVQNLSDDITHALHRSWFFDPTTVMVGVEGGQVRLSGTVGSLHERQVAATTAWMARGVTAVENDLVVV